MSSLALSVFAASGLSVVAPQPSPVAPGPSLDGAPVLVWSHPLPARPPASAARAEPAGPVVHGDIIFVGHSGESALLVLDRRDGALRYRLPTGAPVACAPVVAEPFVYVTDTAGYTQAFRLDALDLGTPAWKHFGGAPIVSTATLADGLLYVTNVDDLVVALDATTGELRWRYAHALDTARGDAMELYGAPAASLSRSRGEVLVGFSDGFLVALGAADGAPRWSASIGEGEYPDLIAPALGAAPETGGSVIVGGYTEPLVALDPESRTVRWRLEAGSAAPFTLHEGALYHGSTDGRLRRIDPRTGDVAWVWDGADGATLGQPVVTARGLLVPSANGTVHLVDPATGANAWTFDPGVNLDGVTAPVAVDGDTVYVVSNAGVLYALRGADTAPVSVSADPFRGTR